MINLTIFNNSLFEAGTEFFNQLGIQLNSNTASSLGAKELLKDHYKDKGIFKAIDEAYFLGLVDDSVFDGNTPLLNKEKISLKEAKDRLTAEYNGLMVFAVWLKDSYSPTRGEIADLTRAFNRVSKSVPVVLLLKYGGLLSFAASERTKYKQAWREGEKIGKISLLKDIKVAAPHTGHLKILDDLKVVPTVTDFNALYKQWQAVFNVQLLNKKFYQELANWYFWALRNVEFPEDAEKNKDVRNAISVIRMITRLIFIWFVKEKGLIPDDLFNQAKLKSLLDFKDKNQSTYYKAILQNLFFATLNTEMNKDRPGSRKFRGKNKGDGRDQHYMIHNVFRYEDYFASPQDTLKKYFENIPFLNGGLFECLDKIIASTGKDKLIRIDGFSDHPKNGLKVPDYLFFSPEQPLDLNEIYGTKNKTYKVRGLIDILDSYKFTVDENTPIEEEIALDPELLGKVFENLLASYNPETQTTARKQTGSFYTPREIVNYMVDESIIAYLTTALERHSREGGNPENPPSSPFSKGGNNNPTLAKGGKGGFEESFELRLRHLVAYNDDPHKFTSAEVDILITAINALKALDPACGSGAFPMGMLHKLVYILGKLDPDNSKWRELQKQKAIKETEEAYGIGDKEEREKRLLDISEVFENNASDYGRKLYLIENCIFGVDIQPIAVQIAKLRFFVSLIVDQRIDPKKENLGVRPLPNLETKFVAANTLIGIEKPAQMMFRNPKIDRKEKELKEVRERHFTARTPQTKEKYRKADEILREEISELLKKDGFPRATTEKLARWNPYDQNAHADFFDSEWMFGITDGFDVVIGNPPYIRAEELGDFKTYLKATYSVFASSGDIFSYFYEKSFNILSTQGVFCFINNAFDKTTAGKALREYIAGNCSLKRYVDFKSVGVFEGTTTYPIILLATKSKPQESFEYLKITDDLFSNFNACHELDYTLLSISALKQPSWSFDHQGQASLSEKISIHKKLREIFGKCYRGIITGINDAFITEKDLGNNEYLKPVFEGKDIKKWLTPAIVKKMIVFENKSTHAIFKGNDETKAFKAMQAAFPAIMGHLKPFAEAARKRYDKGEFWWELRSCAYYDLFAKPKIIFPNLQNANKFAYDISGTHLNAPAVFLPTDAKWLLGILNSTVVWYFLKTICVERSGGFIEVKPQYFEQIPIPPIKDTDKKKLDNLVTQILAAKKKEPSADTSALEKQIDEMVYALYGLTAEEIAIVEGKE